MFCVTFCRIRGERGGRCCDGGAGAGPVSVSDELVAAEGALNELPPPVAVVNSSVFEDVESCRCPPLANLLGEMFRFATLLLTYCWSVLKKLIVVFFIAVVSLAQQHNLTENAQLIT